MKPLGRIDLKGEMNERMIHMVPAEPLWDVFTPEVHCQPKASSSPSQRLLAMYVGEHIAEAVMSNETVRRRVYLGAGSIETAARPESSFSDKTPFLEVERINVHYGKAQALEDVSIHVRTGEFASVVGLNGAGKTTLFNAISGLVLCGDIRQAGHSLPACRRRGSHATGSCRRPKAASSSST